MSGQSTQDPDINGLPAVETTALPPPESRAIMLAGLAAAVLGLVLFAWLAEEVLEGSAARFDNTVREWVHGFASPGLTTAMHAASFVGSGVLIGALVLSLAVFLLLHWRRAALWMTVTMLGATVLDLTLKAVYHRARPVPFFGAAPHDYSFPSGHALFSFCFYGVLAGLVTKRIRSHVLRGVIWISAALAVTAIGFSRIYLGVHYPSDVIAGYLSAAMWVGAMVGTDRYRKRHGWKKKQAGKN